MDNLDSALLFENMALNYALESNYKIYLGTILQIIGDIYSIRSDYGEGGKFYHSAMNASIGKTI